MDIPLHFLPNDDIHLGVQQAKAILESDFDQGMEMAESVYKRALKINDRGGLAVSLTVLCLGKYKSRAYTTALEYGLEALSIYPQDEESDLFLNLIQTIGSIFFRLGDFAQSLSYFQLLESLGRRKEDRLNLAEGLHGQAKVYSETGDYIRALSEMQTALQIYIELEYQRGIVICFNNIAHTYWCMEEYDASVEAARNGLANCPEAHSFARLRGEVMATLCLPLIDLGHFSEVETLIEAAFQISLEVDCKQLRSHLTAIQGRCCAAKGEIANARLYLDTALQRSEELGTHKRTLAIYELLIELMRKEGEFSAALAYYDLMMILQKERFGEQVAIRMRNLEIAHRIGLIHQRMERVESYSTNLERQIAEQTQQLRQVTEHAPVIFFRVLDRKIEKSRFLYIDGRVVEIFEIEPYEILSDILRFWELVHSEDKGALLGELTMVRRELGTLHHNFRIVMQDGRIKWVDVVAQPSTQSDGQIVWDGVLIDQSARRAAEEKAEQAAARLKLTKKSVEIGFWEWSAVDGSVIWDDRMFAIYGLDRRKFTGTAADFEQFLHPDDCALVSHDDLENEKAYFSDEFRIIRQDGEIRYIQAIYYSQRDESGNILKQIGLNIDITEQKKMERALNDSQARFLHMTENVPGMIYQQTLCANGESALTYVSTRVSDIFEIDPSLQLKEIERLMWERVHPEDLPRIISEFKQSINEFLPFASEYRLILPEKGERWVRTITNIYHTEGRDLVWDGLIVDITERKTADLKLKETHAELERATRLKDEFLANMSHELRTPLNAILGMAEGLRDEVFGVLNIEQRDALRTIEESGTHLLALINDILDLSKIEAGQIELSRHPVDFKQLCRSSLNFVRQQAYKKEIDLSIDLPADLPEITLDERRIRQVLINLLNNAVKFTHVGGRVSLDVELWHDSNEHESHFIRFAVSDTGIGIPADKLDVIFEPFVQIESALNRRYKGTGLGLGLVRRIVQLHGGTVAVTSEVEAGSRFVVDLPFLDPVQKSFKRQAPPLSAATHREPKQNKISSPLVLVADDNEANVKSMGSYLRAHGYRVVVAKDGEEAVDLTRLERPDVVLMDAHMPGLDGISAIQKIRKEETLSNIPIILLTASLMELDQIHRLEMGVSEFFEKPIKLKQIVSTIKALLSGSAPPQFV